MAEGFFDLGEDFGYLLFFVFSGAVVECDLFVFPLVDGFMEVSGGEAEQVGGQGECGGEVGGGCVVFGGGCLDGRV